MDIVNSEDNKLGIIIQWAVKEGLSWSSEKVAQNAAKDGHLKIIRWIHENGYLWCKNACLAIASENSHRQVVHWIQDKLSEVTILPDGQREWYYCGEFIMREISGCRAKV